MKNISVVMNGVNYVLITTDLGFPTSSKTPFGSTTRVNDRLYEITININRRLTDRRVALALMHELLHTRNWSAGKERNRHRSCHYLAAALISGQFSLDDLKIEEFALPISKLLKLYSYFISAVKTARAANLLEPEVTGTVEAVLQPAQETAVDPNPAATPSSDLSVRSIPDPKALKSRTLAEVFRKYYS